MNLNKRAGVPELSNFDEVILATGIVPRSVNFEGAGDPRVLSYIDVLQNNAPVGKRVGIIGAGSSGTCTISANIYEVVLGLTLLRKLLTAKSQPPQTFPHF